MVVVPTPDAAAMPACRPAAATPQARVPAFCLVDLFYPYMTLRTYNPTQRGWMNTLRWVTLERFGQQPTAMTATSRYLTSAPAAHA